MAVGSFAQRLLDALEPMTANDPVTAAALETFLGSIGDELFQLIEDYAGDTDDGQAGWGNLLDVNLSPPEALPWLAQVVGVQLMAGLSTDDQRQQIRDLASWQRGTAASIRGAVLPYLTGTKTVIFRERDIAAYAPEPAYGLTIITQTSETPDPTAVLNAILRQKPAGIVLNYEVLTGEDLEEVYLDFATLQTIHDDYATLYGFMTNQLGV